MTLSTSRSVAASLLIAHRAAAASSSSSLSTSWACTTRCIASSSRSAAQVQDDLSSDPPESSTSAPAAEEPQKLGKRARRALKARQRQDEQRTARESRAKAKSETHAYDQQNASIIRVKDVLGGADNASSNAAMQKLELWRSQTASGDGSNPTAGWSGSLFRSHISSLLSGFGTAPSSRQLNESDSVRVPESTPNTPSSDKDEASTVQPQRWMTHVNSPALTKSERMESQARVIFQAIQEARERGIVDEDESFFYPYPEGVPPKDMHGKDAVWLNLGPDPEAWGKEIPQVKDKWLEVLSLGLAKEITGRPSTTSAARASLLDADGEADMEEEHENGYAFNDLVEDYDLEDHERLEQLGDSIVNMSSRLLAYLSYPDVNEGSLTRLSNYPTQNNFLALLFQECGLAARRDELRTALRRARDPTYQDQSDTSRGAPETDEDKARLPLMIKRDADMFEAYAAAVFLSNGNDFNVVHEWLCHLFRPFQDQAYRFMVQRSEALARLQASRAAAAASAAAATSKASSYPHKPSSAGSATNLSADGLGIHSATLDPSSASLSSLFPDFGRSGDKAASAIPTYALNNASEAFITDEFLTVAARARRQREERMREELRLQNQQELMNMGWFRKGFLNLRQGFRQYVMGKDVVQEEEARIRRKVAEQRGLSERDRQRLRAKERSEAGVSIKSTGSKKRHKIAELDHEISNREHS